MVSSLPATDTNCPSTRHRHRTVRDRVSDALDLVGNPQRYLLAVDACPKPIVGAGTLVNHRIGKNVLNVTGLLARTNEEGLPVLSSLSTVDRKLSVMNGHMVPPL